MNQYISYAVINILALLNSIGIHRTDIINSSSNENIDEEFYRVRIEKGIKNFSLTKEHESNISSMLEFGTGAHGIDLMLASLIWHQTNIYCGYRLPYKF